MSTSRRTWWIVGGVAAVLLLVVLYLVNRTEAIEVEVATVERGRVERTATNTRAGTVEAHRRAKLSPEVGGRAVSIPYREGDRVEAGAVVLELDAALEKGEIELRKRQLSAAAAEAQRACLAAERAEREVTRNRQLAADELVAEDVLDRLESAAREADAACAAARASRDSAEAAIRVAREAAAKKTLVAPFAAIVADVSVEVGEFTTPSPPAVPVPPVLDLYDPASIYVSLPMDEVDAASLRTGLPARVTVDSYSGRTFPGTVARVAPYVLDVEAQNRTVEIDVELDDAEFASKLLPGTSADVEVILESRDDALRIPTAALLTGDKALVVEGETLVERELEIGLRNWDFVEARSGLSEGERVVTSLDREEVRAGAKVTVAAPHER